MAGSLQKYTVAEAQNASLGQAGATIIAEQSVHTAHSGDFVAIQFITDSAFTTLTAKSDSWFGSGSGADGTETVSGGTTVSDTTSGVTFPAGMTIYGRWTVIDLTSGSCIAYKG